MTWTPTGRHLIAGEWVESAIAFASDPARGAPARFAVGTAAQIDRAPKAAEDAFWSYGYSSLDNRPPPPPLFPEPHPRRRLSRPPP